MKPPKSYTWTITLEVYPDLVADGFDVANQVKGDDAGGELSTLGRIVDHWPPHFCRVRIVAAPSPELIAAEQAGEFDVDPADEDQDVEVGA